MTAKERRDGILQMLIAQPADEPLNASVIAARFGVSRQIVVGDVALLRSIGEPIVATSRGYCYRSASGQQERVHLLVCLHNAEQMEEELNAIVDFGGKVEDVTVDHPIYGRLTGELHLTCRYDVKRFCERTAEADAKPLSALTEGVHCHRVRLADEEAFERLCRELERQGILLSYE